MGFKEEINKINEVNLNLIEYLKASLESDNKYCKGWDYLKANLTKELKLILTSFEYWDKKYNSEKVEFILNTYSIKYMEKYNLNEEFKKQLESFVYVWNCIKRDCDKREDEDKLKEELLRKGFKEQDILNEEELKKLDGLRVKCVLDVSKIGILGSFDKKEELEGKLVYSDYQKNLMLIPKRCRTRGFIIRKKFYYKIQENKK